MIADMHFEVYELGGDYWFRLASPDCAPLLCSGPQPDLQTCLDSIARLKHIGARADFRHRRSPGGAHYFTVEGERSEILATSNLYRGRRDRDATMTAVREQMAAAPVVLRGAAETPVEDTTRIVAIDPPLL